MDASKRRTNNKRNPCISMGAINSMNKGKSMDGSKRRTNNRRNPCISMGASNIMNKGKSMDASNRRTNNRRYTEEKGKTMDGL
jgi:hypothetical protein